jgi:hypothetical protein
VVCPAWESYKAFVIAACGGPGTRRSGAATIAAAIGDGEASRITGERVHNSLEDVLNLGDDGPSLGILRLALREDSDAAWLWHILAASGWHIIGC